jgi:flagellin
MGGSIGSVNNPFLLNVNAQQAIPNAKSSDDYPTTAKVAAIEVTISMETKLLSLGRAIRNTNDAITLLQKADSYLAEGEEILRRIHTLSISASSALPQEQRHLLQVELSELVDEVDRLSSQANFNRLPLLDGNFSKIRPKASMWFQTGPNVIDRERLYLATMSAAALSLRSPHSKQTISVNSQEKASTALKVTETGLAKIKRQRSEIAGMSLNYEQKINDLKIGLSNTSKFLDSPASETAIEAALQKIKGNLKQGKGNNATN